jgi:hypothetical protein
LNFSNPVRNSKQQQDNFSKIANLAPQKMVFRLFLSQNLRKILYLSTSQSRGMGTQCSKKPSTRDGIGSKH